MKVQALTGSDEVLYKFGEGLGLRREQVDIAVAAFRDCDSDESGEIEEDELFAWFDKLLSDRMTKNLKNTVGRMQFRNVDKDGSGSIDVREFITLYANFLKDYVY